MSNKPIDRFDAPTNGLPNLVNSPKAVPPVDTTSIMGQRLREGSDTFCFDSLLAGVSTLEKTADSPLPVSDAKEKLPLVNEDRAFPLTRKADKPTFLLVVTAFILAGIVVLFGVLGATGQKRWLYSTTANAELNSYLKSGLPDPSWSPGEHDQSTRVAMGKASLDTISPSAQREVFLTYGLSLDNTHYVVCHVIPPLLGGTNNPKNLFPATPWFRGLKRRLDTHLVDLVSANKLSVVQARLELTTNWVKAVHHYPVRNYGESDPKKARQIESKTRWN